MSEEEEDREFEARRDAKRARDAQIRQGGDYEVVDLYLTYNYAEAQLIREILEDNGVHCILRDLEPSQFPFSVGKHSQHRIEVEDFNLAEATALIRQAIAEGALTDDGKFLFEE